MFDLQNSTASQGDRSWEVHCSLRLWNLEGSATSVNIKNGCFTASPEEHVFSSKFYIKYYLIILTTVPCVI